MMQSAQSRARHGNRTSDSEILRIAILLLDFLADGPLPVHSSHRRSSSAGIIEYEMRDMQAHIMRTANQRQSIGIKEYSGNSACG
jgi:hypothetical protein